MIVEVHGSAGRTTPKLVLHRSSWCPLVLRYNAILHVDPSKMDVAPAENCTHCFRDRAAGG